MRTHTPIASFQAVASTALALRMALRMALCMVLCTVLSMALSPRSASAAAPLECDGVSFPAQVQARGETLILNGLGLRKATLFNIRVYVGALYVPHPTTSAEAILNSREPAEIELRFVFHATTGQLRSAWQEGFEKAAPAQLPQLQSRIDQLKNWMNGVGSGQQMTFLRIPGVGIQYSLDGAIRGTIGGDDFAKAFLAIWLGSSPPNPELRAGLLGGPCK